MIIYRNLFLRSIGRNVPSRIPQRALEISQCSNEGMNISDIADALGVTKSNISKMALKYNIKIAGQYGKRS